MPIRVRSATSEDLDAVADLWEELTALYRRLDSTFWQPAPDARATVREWYAEAVRDSRRRLLVAEADGSVIGFVHADLHTTAPPMADRVIISVSDLAVSERWRRRGAGQALMDAVVAAFEDEGPEEVSLMVAVANADARAFYRDLGFEEKLLYMRRPLEDSSAANVRAAESDEEARRRS